MFCHFFGAPTSAKQWRPTMYLWLIPMVYVGASVAVGLALPRIEHTYLTSHTLNLSITSAQAYLSAAASGLEDLRGMARSRPG